MCLTQVMPHCASSLYFGKVAQLGTAPDSKSGKWTLFMRGFKSRPFLNIEKS